MKLIIFIVLLYASQSDTKFASKEDDILKDLSWGTKIKILKDKAIPSRRVGISMLRSPDEEQTAAPNNAKADSEDGNMKIKLFRLMYETIRDSDTKVKRAELIKAHYANYTSFEFGFIMGDLMDKFNIVTDISMTMKRLYKDWKPMEHINAYEQIANKAIEINHLIDIIKVINKKSNY
ncbi:uncharacterized protein LOC124542344 [Vanessa cardui]|uniref:uncharacterized protein LOC124542344 n=1 Tax=Vanessa cardui TaxID=171605 RepID=UPI001F12976D|nr:uncharacterized protein LOC124542344 [Vanessa cardui]